MTLPLVAVVADTRQEAGQRYHSAGDKYLRPLAELAGAMPVLLPALDLPLDLDTLLDRFDGFCFTGSPSNIEPSHYGLDHDPRFEPYDPARDAVCLPLIRAAVAAGRPLLAICRGLQELNVALGGSLHPAVHEVPGRLDHREPAEGDLASRYAPSHAVRFSPGGLLQSLTGQAGAEVNSLHRQAINRLAPGLLVEAEASDGTIEAVRVKGPGFGLALQWHPEFAAAANPVSVAIYRAFAGALVSG
jgi:putative glutamine amidotransferase